MNSTTPAGASLAILSHDADALLATDAGGEREAQTHPVALYLLSLGRHAANPARSRRVALSALDRAALVMAGQAEERRSTASGRGRDFDWRNLTPERLGALLDYLSTHHRLTYAFSWRNMAPAHLEAMAAMLADRYSPSYARAIMAHVRGVLRADWRQGGIPGERMDRMRAVEAPTGEPERTGRALNAYEVGALIRACKADAKPARGARDAAALALLYGAGLRRSEAVAIHVDQLDLAAGWLRRVKRKRGKVRDVPMLGGADDLLAWWIRVRGDAPGPVLAPVGQVGDVRAGGITPAAVAAILARLADAVGVEAFTAHDLRRTGATRFYDATRDIDGARQWLGHASVETTQRYLKLGERQLDAVRSVPMV